MLEKLNEVQGVDLKLDALQEERGQTPEELTIEAERKRDLERRLERKTLERDELRRRVAANELDLKTLGQRKRDASDSALRATTTKEASQYQNQELQFATRVQELEEDTLPLMEGLESVQAEVTALQEELEAMTPEYAAMLERERQRLKEIDVREARLGQERSELAAGISAPLLKQYEHVRKARRGVGLVEIVGNERCGGCNVKLPIHVIQKAKAAKAVTRCPSCGRILWPKNNSETRG